MPHFFAIATCLFQALMNACVKALGPDVPATLVMSVRCLTGLAVFYPFIHMAGGFKAVMVTRNRQKQITRALLSAFGVTCSYVAIRYLPLGDAMALWNTYGFFLLMLSVPILGERVSFKQYFACAIGFLGVLLIARPHGETHYFAILIMLVSAASSAAGTLTVRLMSREDKEITILTWFFIVSSIASVIVWLIFAEKAPLSLREIVLLICGGLFGSMSQLSMTKAFRHLGADRMASYAYSGIVFSMIIGFTWFSEVPTLWMLAGAVLIVIGMQTSRYFNKQKTITL
jgi:drug/metabolite transporter (DMT)-like permease